jgi:uncharacterized transporter YbjL
MGGLLFALEVILQDFSIRSVTPIVVASVVANVATKAIFASSLLGSRRWEAIFQLPPMDVRISGIIVGNFVLLGIICGVIGVTVTRITRADLEMTAVPNLRLQFGDVLQVVGDAARVEKFAARFRFE